MDNKNKVMFGIWSNRDRDRDSDRNRDRDRDSCNSYNSTAYSEMDSTESVFNF